MEEESERLSVNEIEDTSHSVVNLKHKRRFVLDSDESDSDEKPSETKTGSDKETTKNTESFTLLEDTNTEAQLIKKSKPTRLAIIDSDDSETDEKDFETDNRLSKEIEAFDPMTSNKLNEVRIVSEETEADKNNKNEQVLKSNIVYITNNKGQLIPEDNALFEETKNKLNALCDSDTSEDDNKEESVTEKISELENIKSTFKRSSNKKGLKKPKVKTKKMTGKEALEQRKEIFNESQKRLRNLNVTIPYHKPKCRSLKEFLSNKPKISSTVPTINTPPSVAIKLASQQLNIITEKIEEHEKVLQVFYKSDSEPEDDCEEQEDKTPLNTNKESINEVGDEDKPEVNSPTRQTNLSDEENKISSPAKEIMEVEKNVDTTECLSNEETEDFIMVMDEEEPKEGSVNEDKAIKDQYQVLDITEKENIQEGENTTQNNKYSNISDEKSTSLFNEEAMEIVERDEILHEDKTKENLQAKSETNFYKEISETIESPENGESQESIDTHSSNENNNIDNLTEKTTNEKNKEVNLDTFEYDFNLDEVEIDNTEEEVLNINETERVGENSLFDEKEEKILKNIIKNFTNAEQPEDITNRPTKLQLLKEKLNSLKQPKLSGNPNEVIIFGDDKPEANGIIKLKGRFLNHALAKRTHKNEVHTEVVCFDGEELRKETVVMTVDAEDEPVAVMEKPGAKHQKLREELQTKIMKNKSEKWQTKSTPFSCNEEQLKEEKKCSSDLDNDEEEALLSDSDLSEEEENDEEEEEEDEDMVVQKKAKKCDFIDEEAEQSDDEEAEEREANSEDNENEKQSEECSENPKKKDFESQLSNSPKKHRRIVKRFADDDSDEEEKDQTDDKQNKPKDKNSSGFNVELDSTQSCDEDDVLPAYQPRTESPVRQPTEYKDNFDFLTPVTFLTGLQSYSASKFLRESPKEISFPLLNSSQSKDDTNTSQEQENDEDISQQSGGPQRKLTFDLVDPTMNSENTSSQSDMENIALLCSGTFSTQPEKDIEHNLQESKEISSCAGVSQIVNDDNKSVNVCTPKSSGSTTNRIVEKVFLDKIDKEVKNLSNSEFENVFISQLLDEEEMKNFKKKFESPVNDQALNLDVKSASNEDHDVRVKGGRLILGSSDEEIEDEGCERNLTKKKKKITMKKISFSDDESDSDEESNNDQEEIDLHDDIVEDEEEERLNTSKKNVNYDSEENEIEDNENGDDNGDEEDKVPLKPSDFFENEAELSESEWGSEDEVENEELDKLEIEEGDKEKFDEVEVRRNLEKIHMRQVLDDDNREIKILQELLLEDGELHGSGRKRQFRWKDMDLLFGNENAGKENEEGNVSNQDEIDSEERWRKMRYYRELFLKEKMEKGNMVEKSEITLLSSSHQIMELGQKALQRSLLASQNNSQTMDLKTPKPNDSSYDEPHSIFNKRGSFLSRTDKILTRMAELTKAPTNPILGVPKSSKNFVFKQVSEVICTTKAPSSSKRKLNPEKPKSLKKIKLSSTLNVN